MSRGINGNFFKCQAYRNERSYHIYRCRSVRSLLLRRSYICFVKEVNPKYPVWYTIGDKEKIKREDILAIHLSPTKGLSYSKYTYLPFSEEGRFGWGLGRLVYPPSLPLCEYEVYSEVPRRINGPLLIYCNCSGRASPGEPDTIAELWPALLGPVLLHECSCLLPNHLYSLTPLHRPPAHRP